MAAMNYRPASLFKHLRDIEALRLAFLVLSHHVLVGELGVAPEQRTDQQKQKEECGVMERVIFHSIFTPSLWHARAPIRIMQKNPPINIVYMIRL
jgi:hypothetical protein